MNIDEIIEECGGEIDLSYELRISQGAIAQWKTRGIPERWWSQIIALSGCCLGDLHEINQTIRKNSAKQKAA